MGRRLLHGLTRSHQEGPKAAELSAEVDHITEKVEELARGVESLLRLATDVLAARLRLRTVIEEGEAKLRKSRRLLAYASGVLAAVLVLSIWQTEHLLSQKSELVAKGSLANQQALSLEVAAVNGGRTDLLKEAVDAEEAAAKAVNEGVKDQGQLTAGLVLEATLLGVIGGGFIGTVLAGRPSPLPF